MHIGGFRPLPLRPLGQMQQQNPFAQASHENDKQAQAFPGFKPTDNGQSPQALQGVQPVEQGLAPQMDLPVTIHNVFNGLA